ncbi:MAG: hypothetical protein ACYS21_06600, partial [Planctomycetota bacterium]
MDTTRGILVTEGDMTATIEAYFNARYNRSEFNAQLTPRVQDVLPGIEANMAKCFLARAVEEDLSRNRSD